MKAGVYGMLWAQQPEGRLMERTLAREERVGEGGREDAGEHHAGPGLHLADGSARYYI